MNASKKRLRGDEIWKNALGGRWFRGNSNTDVVLKARKGWGCCVAFVTYAEISCADEWQDTIIFVVNVKLPIYFMCRNFQPILSFYVKLPIYFV